MRTAILSESTLYEFSGFAPMLALGLMLLAAASDPPKKLKPIFYRDDYPVEALRKGEQGEVVADLLINPSGGVETCSVILSSGFQDLDQATCALIQTRARFVPATDAGGHTMYSVTRSPPITWSLGSFHTVPVEPDYDLTINRAPDGVRLPFELKVEYLVTRDGKAQNCVPSRDKSAPAELVALACQAVASAPAQVLRDHNGVPVEAQNQAAFRFSLDKRQSK